jgi:NAD(P)-dependent dehydrogenase (short-subunit alcohol dehydrogenase family)
MTEVALIVGGGPGVSASCARLFAQQGMRVAVAARNPGKPALTKLVEEHQVSVYECDAAEPDSVASLFATVSRELGSPRLVVHNIDGRTQHIFRKEITKPIRTWCSIRLETPRSVHFSLANKRRRQCWRMIPTTAAIEARSFLRTRVLR